MESGVRLLSDLRAVFGERATMSSEDIIKALVAIEEAAWADLRAKPLDARRLANYLHPYGVDSRNIRADGEVVKGYAREDLHDPWTRYLGSPPKPPSPLIRYIRYIGRYRDNRMTAVEILDSTLQSRRQAQPRRGK